MKKIPNSVTIFGRKIPVKNISSKDILKLYPEFTHAPQGLWDSCNRFIVINKDFPLLDQTYTLNHEIAHCVMTFVGLDLVIDQNIQEIIVQSMATLIEDVLNQQKIFK
jgi:Zn-dependent peptidase ImmA (M78 family)